MKITFAALTDVGLVRQNNEDNYVVFDASLGGGHTPPPASYENTVVVNGRGTLVAVADGMGGALAGEVASRMAVEALMQVAAELSEHEEDEAVRDRILKAIALANQRIFEASQKNPDQRGMGTTLTAALVRAGRIQFFQVGDSKGFISREGKLFQMTKDHSLIGQLVDDKVITPEDAEQLEGGRNIILKALGAEETIKIDYSEAPLDEGDIVLLCTDGLHGCLKNRELEEIVAGSSDSGKLCEDLVREAKERGGPDNITVVTVSVLEASEPPPPPGIMERLRGLLKRVRT